MIQKGDDLINGGNSNYQYAHINQNPTTTNDPPVANVGNLTQAMSFEDYVPQQETTLPPVETVLPQYIPTPPPSLPSPSVNMTTMINAPHFQLQHHTNTTTTPQHNHHQNINSQHHQQDQQQQVAIHSSPHHIYYNHMHNNTTNTQSTSGTQLLVDNNFTPYSVKGYIIRTNYEPSQMPSNSQNLSQDTLLNVSDTSTVDADETENLNDEPFTYLQNLNSDNLMKFSQQSALQQLIEEQMDIKPKLNLIPTCEEHDRGGYNFRIQVNSTDVIAQRPGVVFSKVTQKLYIKTNENVYIDCFYTQKMPIQPLRIRVFAVFDKDTSDPVLRCQNHISKDTDPDERVRRSILRCNNPDATYHGSDTGKCINERYSVLVPLNTTVKGTDTNELKQQLIINFTCYNSCMNRKQTAAMFLLEGLNGEILAQRILPVKISTCPKRDRRLLEEPVGSCKRRCLDEPDYCPSDPKMSKFDDSSMKDEYSRSSFDEAASDDGNGNANIFGGTVHEKETGEFVLTLNYKSRHQLLQDLQVLYSNAITKEVFYKTSINGKRTYYSDSIKKLYDNTLKLKTRKNSTPSVKME